MGDAIQFQGNCQKCGIVTYQYSREQLKRDLANNMGINLMCTSCNGSRAALPVERERLSRIAGL
jgi:Fe-S cluster biogenesis protein NfuA